jgi:hypothetical protein
LQPAMSWPVNAAVSVPANQGRLLVLAQP